MMSNHRYQPDTRIEKLDGYKKTAEYLVPLMEEICLMHDKAVSELSPYNYYVFRNGGFNAKLIPIYSMALSNTLIAIITLCIRLDLSIEGEINKAIDIINDGYYHDDTEI